MEEEKSLRGRTLRRRLSVELSDEPKSPSAPSTPTKKRGRLATKPLLDNIDENAVVSSPKRTTRKSTVSESNDDKPLTPARRTNRILSNTSIASDITQGIESPRALRAARRNSFAGSDTEGPATPVRTTRRTRRDSSSSVENMGDMVVKLNTLGVVVEETSKTSPKIAADIDKNKVTQKKVEADKIDKNNLQTTSLSSKNDILYNKNIEVLLDSSNNLEELLRENTIKSTTSKKNFSDDLNKSQEPENPKSNRSLNISPTPTRVSPRLLARRSRENSSDIKVDGNNYVSSNEKMDTDKQSSENNQNYTNNVSPSKIKNVIKNNCNDTNTCNNTSNKINCSEVKTNNVAIKDVVVVIEHLKSVEDALLNKPCRKKSSEKGTVLDAKINSLETVSDKQIIKDNLDKNSGELPQNIFLMSGELQSAISLEDSDSNTEPNIMNKEIVGEDQCVPIVVQPEITIINPTVKIDDTSCEPMDVDETIPENISVIDNDINNETRLSSSFEKDKENRHDTNKHQENEHETPQNHDFNRSNLTLSSLNNSKRQDEDILQKERKLSLSNSILHDHETRKSLKDLQVIANSPVVMNTTVEKTSQNTSTSLDLDDSLINDSKVKKKRKSTISNFCLQDKSTNQSKSTLILSQLKDNSTNDLDTTNTDSPKTLEFKNKKISVNKSNNNTPLKHKNLKQIGLKTSTPNVEIDKTEKTLNENESQVNDYKESSNQGTSDEETSDEETKSANNLLYDEAEEANDSYESGDSLDETERKYQKENEIPLKGETLTSGDNYSDDSEYEKDSFVVSSSEEDEDLLTGSGDDLDMSDNELKMTAYSKKKYDARKDKERKQASREMYEARHNIKQSKEKRKRNRLRLDSTADSSLDQSINKSVKNTRKKLNSDSSDDEIKKPTLKNKLKLDSTSDDITVVNEKSANDSSTLLSKSKRSSTGKLGFDCSTSNTKTSICIDEQEITFLEENDLNKKDPLLDSVLVKSEPKTPQKGDNFTVQDEIEEMDVDENVSMINVPTEKVDPLAEDEPDMNESDSDDKEIKNNYDSVLNNLNNLQKTNKTSSVNISLNLDRKVNTGNKKPTIIDELNLTQMKGNKKNWKQNSLLNENNDESSSSSLDLQDFFSKYSDTDEENGESHTKDDYIPFKINDHNVENKRKSSSYSSPTPDKDVSNLNESLSKNKIKKDKKDMEHQSSNTDKFNLDDSTSKSKKKKNTEQTEDIASQKNTKSNKNESVAKLEKSVLDAVEDVILNDSKSKRKHSISKQAEIDLVLEASTIDTDDLNESPPNTKFKKKHNFQSEKAEIINDDPMSRSLNESTTKKKNKKNSLSELNNTVIPISETLNESTTNKKKKKHSLSEQGAEQHVPESNNIDKPTSISLNESNTKKKKKKHSLTEQDPKEDAIEPYNTDEPMLITLNESITKKKKKQSLLEQASEENILNNTDKCMSLSLNESITKKKKKKHSMSEQGLEETVTEPYYADKLLSVSLNESTTKKKKKKHSMSEQGTEETATEANHKDITKSINLDESTSKKKKNKHSVSEQAPENSVTELNNTDKSMSISLNESKKKKKKHSISELGPKEIDSESNNGDIISLEVENNIQKSESKKERKRKSSSAAASDLLSSMMEVLNSSDRSSIAGNKMKKEKLPKKNKSPLDESQIVQEKSTEESESLGKKQRKKAKEISSLNLGIDLLVQSHIEHSQENKNKKRKRIENEESTQNKAFKEHIHDNVKVRRLPQAILDQLGQANARKDKQTNITSTTEFNVEHIRNKRSKPSEYLEESIHLQSVFEKPKRELKIKRPKILPSLPSAAISSHGFTTNFQINILANSNNPFTQTSDFKNFRHESLYGSRIKRMNAFDKCKKLRSIKLAKF